MEEKHDALSESISKLIGTSISTGISPDVSHLLGKYTTLGIGSSSYTVPDAIYEMEPWIKPISRIPFQYDLYLSGKYTPITKNGNIVVIVNVDEDPDVTYPISGFIQGGKPGFEPSAGDTWTIEGHLFRKTDDEILSPSLEETRKALGDTYDLMLIPKPDSFIEVPPATPVVEKPATVEYKLSSKTREKYYVFSIKGMDIGKVEPFMSGHYNVLADALDFVSKSSRECIIVNSVDIPGLREMMIEKGHLIPK